MPGRNMTGPRGEGQLTGRGMGPCGGGMGYGYVGRGNLGCRRGFGRGFAAFADNEPYDPKEMLESRQASLKRQLETVTRRLDELKGE